MLWRDTMTSATLIKKTFNWDGLLTVSEVQSTIIMTDSTVACRQLCWGSWECYILQAPGGQQAITLREFEFKRPQSLLDRDTLPPTMPHLLKVPLCLWVLSSNNHSLLTCWNWESLWLCMNIPILHFCKMAAVLVVNLTEMWIFNNLADHSLVFLFCFGKQSFSV